MSAIQMSSRTREIEIDKAFERAVAFSQQGELDQAEAACKAILARQPDYFNALHFMGELSYHQNRLEEAQNYLSIALRLQPHHVTVLSGLGLVQMRLGSFEEALQSLDKALAINPGHVDALVNRGNALLELKHFEKALATYDKALALRPQLAEALYNRGNALRELARFDEALASYDRTLALQPRYAEALHNRGNVLRELNRPNLALASHEKALALKPEAPEIFNDKGVILSELGRIEEAIGAFEAAIRLDPKQPRFYFHLSSGKRFRPGDPHITAMLDMAKDLSKLSNEEQTELHFALGKALGDLGDHDGSFYHLLDGNALKRKSIAYDEATALDDLSRMQSAFTRDLIARGSAGNPSEAPIFILGMPRSGSTLIEQILASHPQVHGAGEIKDFVQVAADIAGRFANPEMLTGLSTAQLERLGGDYVARLQRMAPGAARVTDKMLDNFRFVGLIHMALPNARIIHMRRDPIDICVSCFSKLFEKNNLPFTYDLAELGRYYRAYEALMVHWRKVLPPGVMLDLQYENVVKDLEGKAREILGFCGLDWDPCCLDFHKTERPVLTASKTQVRQPLFKTSMGRWRVYEKHLGPLRGALCLPKEGNPA